MTAEAAATQAAWEKYVSCLFTGATREQREFAMAVYSKALDRQIAREHALEKPTKEKAR